MIANTYIIEIDGVETQVTLQSGHGYAYPDDSHDQERLAAMQADSLVEVLDE